MIPVMIVGHAMGIVADILGPAGTAAGAAFGAFGFAERIASKDAKVALAQQIKMLNFDSASILSEGATEIFRKVFTERHWSLRCFWRSATFSILGILLLTIIYYIINPTALASDLDVVGRKVLFVWTVESIAAGYLAGRRDVSRWTNTGLPRCSISNLLFAQPCFSSCQA
jgi:hypothetical protein